jgi:hypothetical protein
MPPESCTAYFKIDKASMAEGRTYEVGETLAPPSRSSNRCNQ